MAFNNADATNIVTEYYKDYAIYVLETRALADVRDGLKSVQRRLVFEAEKFPDSMTKSANIIGNTVKIHPHSSESIYGALVGMTCYTNRLPLFDGKGNWGGHTSDAAASRYTGCKLSEHARFNYTQFVDDADYMIGEVGYTEPSALSSLIPYALISGSQGIGVGFTSNVVPLDLLEVIDYYIATIQRSKRKKIPRPDFGEMILLGNKSDIEKVVREYGGPLSLCPVIKQESNTVLVVECLYKRNIEAVLKSLSHLIASDKVDFRNETSEKERYVFEIMDNGVSLVGLRSLLEKACSVKVNFNRLMVEDGKAVYCSLQYVVDKSLEYLNKVLDKKFQRELEKRQFNLQVLMALKELKNSPIFKTLPSMKTSEVRSFIEKNYSSEVSAEVVKKPLSYLTKDHDGEIDTIKSSIAAITSINREEYLIQLYEDYRNLVLPFYQARNHTIYESEVSSDTLRISMNKERTSLIASHSGDDFDKKIFILTDTGQLFVREINVVTPTEIALSDISEKIAGFATDKHRYFVVSGTDNKAAVFAIENLTQDKLLIKLSSKDKIARAFGINDEKFKLGSSIYKVDRFLRSRTSAMIARKSNS